jgi:1-aminocyclopropane-1-carboxylate deaminase/D-cysteine desulfhydrase-like pyridoxal-dependent ACC family enzyme
VPELAGHAALAGSLLDLSRLNPPLETLQWPLFDQHRVSVKVLRLDLLHPHLGGNKWFKLRHNLDAIVDATAVDSSTRVVSFGGAWSNHLRALAAAGREFGFATLGLVRGEETRPLNPVLSFVRQCGMELRYLSRSDYRRRNDPAFIRQLSAGLGPVIVLPEGGGNALGVAGCEAIAGYLGWESPGRLPGRPSSHLPRDRRFVMLACGTGATAAGIIRGLMTGAQDQAQSQSQSQASVTVKAVAVLKAPGYLQRQIASWLPEARMAKQMAGQPDRAVHWEVLEDYHCGGYARVSDSLTTILETFGVATGLPLEPVYTGKLVLALIDQVQTGQIPAGSEVILIHTGGIHPSG